jgi:hypothetical protein
LLNKFKEKVLRLLNRAFGPLLLVQLLPEAIQRFKAFSEIILVFKDTFEDIAKLFDPLVNGLNSKIPGIKLVR